MAVIEWKPKPFDKILVRQFNDSWWQLEYFAHYVTEDSIAALEPGFFCVHGHYKYAIPYEGNEKLFGTTTSTRKKYEIPEDWRYCNIYNTQLSKVTKEKAQKTLDKCNYELHKATSGRDVFSLANRRDNIKRMFSKVLK